MFEIKVINNWKTTQQDAILVHLSFMVCGILQVRAIVENRLYTPYTDSHHTPIRVQLLAPDTKTTHSALDGQRNESVWW